jgi:DNA-binding protein H-NS
VAAKYRDPNSGQTWTGRGRSPKWLEGKDKKQFLIG